MDLLLVRHAEAVRLGEAGARTDEERPLTEAGRGHADRLADALAGQGLNPGAVVTSGLIRANETAAPLLRLLTADPREATVCQYLAPDHYRPKKLTRFVLGLGQPSTILVGHHPDLSAFASWLTGAEPSAIELAKGAALLIRFDGEAEKGAGRVVWLVTPEWYAGSPVTYPS